MLPRNEVFYHLAYAVATAIYAGYALLLVMRWNRVKARHTRESGQ